MIAEAYRPILLKSLLIRWAVHSLRARSGTAGLSRIARHTVGFVRVGGGALHTLFSC